MARLIDKLYGNHQAEQTIVSHFNKGQQVKQGPDVQEVLEKLNENFNKGLIGDEIYEGACSELDQLVKARTTKYIRREGTKGNYRYIYKEGQGPKGNKEDDFWENKGKKDENKLKVGDIVRIPKNLTTDPANKQGEVGRISKIRGEDEVTVTFKDGHIGRYQLDAVEKVKKEVEGKKDEKKNKKENREYTKHPYNNNTKIEYNDVVRVMNALGRPKPIFIDPVKNNTAFRIKINQEDKDKIFAIAKKAVPSVELVEGRNVNKGTFHLYIPKNTTDKELINYDKYK